MRSVAQQRNSGFVCITRFIKIRFRYNFTRPTIKSWGKSAPASNWFTVALANQSASWWNYTRLLPHGTSQITSVKLVCDVAYFSLAEPERDYECTLLKQPVVQVVQLQLNHASRCKSDLIVKFDHIIMLKRNAFSSCISFHDKHWSIKD